MLALQFRQLANIDMGSVHMIAAPAVKLPKETPVARKRHLNGRQSMEKVPEHRVHAWIAG